MWPFLFILYRPPHLSFSASIVFQTPDKNNEFRFHCILNSLLRTVILRRNSNWGVKSLHIFKRSILFSKNSFLPMLCPDYHICLRSKSDMHGQNEIFLFQNLFSAHCCFPSLATDAPVVIHEHTNNNCCLFKVKYCNPLVYLKNFQISQQQSCWAW
jgi:hypothetical protein